MIVDTQAIALRIHPFARTSHLVTWLSAEHGRVVTSVKGACRPKSAFLGQYGVGQRCELLFYRRDRDGIHTARACSPLDWRPHLRSDWRAGLVAGYCCSLVARVAQPGLDAAGLFELLDLTLDRLSGPAPADVVALWFELALLGHAGLAPNLEPCPRCGPTPPPSTRFALLAGRTLCPHSPPAAPGEPTVTVTPALLDLLRAWQACDDPARLPRPPGDANRTVGLNRFLGMFVQCHLETPAAGRRALFAWLDLRPPAPQPTAPPGEPR